MPKTAAMAQELLPAQPFWGTMADLHIMVVEDDRDTLEYMNDLLSLYGYQVTPWHTALHAIERIEEHQPDLVVLDNRLDHPPNGYEILEDLHTRPSTSHIPVILYSAEGVFLHSHHDNVLRMGGDTLPKPFQPNELLEKIKALTNT